MKIAHVVWTLSIGGIQTMLVDIVNEQVKTQDVAIFVVNNVVNDDIIHKIDKRVLLVRCNRRPGSKNLLPIIKLNWELQSFHPNIIHCHEDKLTYLLFHKRTPLVRTIHNTHSSPNEYTRFGELCCISQAVKKYTASQGFTDSKVVFNGIHTEQIPTRSSSVTECKRIVCVGRLHPMKGQRLLIEAVNELVNERKQKDFIIDLIGDGELREELEELVRRYHIQNHVHFFGGKPREWFYPKLKDYDLFVLPSICEGFGLTLAEACAAKIPVLTCDLPGPMEVIADGRYGSYFKTGDSHSLANELEHLIVNGFDSHKVENACMYVRENFDVTVTSQKYIYIYKELL